MPIKPENKKRYPANWKEIRKGILQNVEKKCPFFEEKKCGQWEDNGRCNYCGAFSVSHGADYCSNCGARMDGTPKERGGEK